MKRKTINNPPSANILMNSLRSIGYTFEASVADILDNSIGAHAKNIWIDLPPSYKHLYLSILDDGCGMDKDELIEAMRYGSKHRGITRSVDDLGRFGMGLKSASLSNCRILTVISKKDEIINALQWNINHVDETDTWDVLEIDPKEYKELYSYQRLKELQSGTIVLWEDFDSLNEDNEEDLYDVLSTKVASTSEHLSLIFHRYINSIGSDKISIYINERKIIGYDPFLESHTKTDIKKEREISYPDKNGTERIIKIQPFVLPFYKDLTSKDYEKLGGKDKFSKNQGFYIYRNKRLIVWGDWFGMQPKNELFGYARIRVDIPNTLDDQCKIDVKKQQANIPRKIRIQLVNTVEGIVRTSKNKNEHRAKFESSSETSLWSKHVTREKTYIYKFNRDSYIMENLEKALDSSQYKMVLGLIETIEASIPYQSIFNDVAQKQTSSNLEGFNIEWIAEFAANIIISNSKSRGKTDLIKEYEKICSKYPFNDETVKKIVWEMIINER